MKKSIAASSSNLLDATRFWLVGGAIAATIVAAVSRGLLWCISALGMIGVTCGFGHALDFGSTLGTVGVG